jgi:hypothetical protein
MLKHNVPKSIGLLLLLASIGIIGSLVYVSLDQTDRNHDVSISSPDREDSSAPPASTPISQPVSSPLGAETNEPVEPKTINLYRTEAGNPILVFSLPFSEREPIIKWNNWLIYEENKDIYRYNIDTYKKDLLIDTHELFADKDENVRDDYNYVDDVQISDLTIIENDLYVSYSMYLNKPGTYWISLEEPSSPQKLYDSRNAVIRHIYERYWLIGGEGDACWHQSDYSLLDPENKTIQYTLEYGNPDTCFIGEDVLLITNDDQIITEVYTGRENTSGQQLTSLRSASVTDTSQTINLIDLTTISPPLLNCIVDESTESIYCSSTSTLYRFELTSRALVPLTSYTDAYDNVYLRSADQDGICVIVYTEGEQPYLLIESGTGDILEIDSPTCHNKYPSYTNEVNLWVKQQLSERFDQFELPDEYYYQFE